MELPLWYRVAQRKISYKDFETTFQNPLFAEKEAFLIFFFATLYRHDPYIEGDHVLHRLMKGGSISDRELKYFYLYRTFRPESNDEKIYAGSTETIGNFSIILPYSFSELLQNLLKLCLRSLFDIGYIEIPLQAYPPRDFFVLQRILQYFQENESKYHFKHQVVSETYTVVQIEENLQDLVKFFRGERFPKTLTPYRNQPGFFSQILSQSSPELLFSCAPFSSSELEMIRNHHRKLYEKGDVHLFLGYVHGMKKYFGDSEITQDLSMFLLPTKQNDYYLVYNFLYALSPQGRARYLLQKIPVFDSQLNSFLKRIPEIGIEKLLLERVAYNRENLLREISQAGLQLDNEQTLASQDPIEFYLPDDFIWHSEGEHLYLFLKSDFQQIDRRINPYNRKTLPESLFENLSESSPSIEDLWSHVLRRKIELHD